MTELAIPAAPSAIAPVAPISERGVGLAVWAREAEAANHLAKALCITPFAGVWQNDEWGATAAILKGSELGFSPTTSLSAFDKIQGKPAIGALTMRALVQSKGHSIEIVESTNERAVARYKRSGDSEYLTTEFTIEDARGMGLLTKPNWQSQPQNMLVARVTTKAARLVAADLLLGIGYSTEELRDHADDRPFQQPSGQRPSASERMAAVLPPQDVQQQENTQAETSVAEGVAGSIPASDAPAAAPADDKAPTQEQMKKMGALMRKAGLNERTSALAYVEDVIGRKVASRNELTRGEVARVIDDLEIPAAVARPTDAVEEPVDAEIVPDPTGELWNRVLVAAAAEGMTTADAEDDFARENGGLSAADATVEQLQAYLDVLTRKADA